MALSEFAWAATITCFPDKSWGSICNKIILSICVFTQRHFKPNILMHQNIPNDGSRLRIGQQNMLRYHLQKPHNRRDECSDAYMLSEISNSSSRCHFQTFTIGRACTVTSPPFMNLLFSISFSRLLFVKTL